MQTVQNQKGNLKLETATIIPEKAG